MTTVGELALWIALFLAVWGSVAAFGGAIVHRPELVESAIRSIRASFAMTALACIGLLASLLNHDLSLQYVVSHTALNTPTGYLITALWAGPAGATLFFALALSACSVAVLWRRRATPTGDVSWIVGALSGVLALILVALCFITNPYDRVGWVPAEGLGLNPRLQTPLAAPYYAATYVAYGAAAIPFARAVSAAATRSPYGNWISSVHRWTLATWIFLTVSIVLRMRWTYVEPVAGKLWQADLSNAATVGAWLLDMVLLWTFARSPRTSSVRVVSAVAFTAFCFALVGVAAIPRPPGPRDASGTSAGGLWALGGFVTVAAAVIYWGVRRLPRARVRVDGATRRPLAVMTVYVGAAILLVGTAAAYWWTDTTISLRSGASSQLADPYGRRWRFVSQGASRDEGINYLSTGVALEAWRGARRAGIISAERRQYLDSVQRTIGEPALRAGIRTAFESDVYVVLMEVGSESAQLRVGFRPLVAFVWIGWLVLALGGLGLGAGRAPRFSHGTEIAVPVTA